MCTSIKLFVRCQYSLHRLSHHQGSALPFFHSEFGISPFFTIKKIVTFSSFPIILIKDHESSAMKLHWSSTKTKDILTHRIHGTNGIFTPHEWLIFMVFMYIGKYTSPMDGMGELAKRHFVQFHVLPLAEDLSVIHVWGINFLQKRPSPKDGSRNFQDPFKLGMLYLLKMYINRFPVKFLGKPPLKLSFFQGRVTFLPALDMMST